MEGLRSDYDPRMESVEDYRDRMRRYVAICALRELPVDEQAIAEQVVRADVLSAMHGLEGQQAVQYLKESACALLMEARWDPEGQTTLKVLINQLERYGVTLSSSQDKLFSGHTTNSSPERPGRPPRVALSRVGLAPATEERRAEVRNCRPRPQAPPKPTC